MRRPLIVLGLLLAMARPAHADWGPGGIPIAQTLVGGEFQDLRGVVSDGSGGVHVGWLRRYFDSSFHQTFEWLLESETDAHGNTILYEYAKESGSLTTLENTPSSGATAVSLSEMTTAPRNLLSSAV